MPSNPYIYCPHFLFVATARPRTARLRQRIRLRWGRDRVECRYGAVARSISFQVVALPPSHLKHQSKRLGFRTYCVSALRATTASLAVSNRPSEQRPAMTLPKARQIGPEIYLLCITFTHDRHLQISPRPEELDLGRRGNDRPQ